MAAIGHAGATSSSQTPTTSAPGEAVFGGLEASKPVHPPHHAIAHPSQTNVLHPAIAFEPATPSEGGGASLS